MKIRLLCKISVCLTAILICPKTSAMLPELPEQPNILFIAVDDLGLGPATDTERLIAEQTSGARTTIFETLRNNGITFDNAYVTAPWCNPSRVSMLTGLNPLATGVHFNDAFGSLGSADPVSEPQSNWREWMRPRNQAELIERSATVQQIFQSGTLAEKRAALGANLGPNRLPSRPNYSARQNYGNEALGNVTTIFEHMARGGYNVSSFGKIFHSRQQLIDETSRPGWNFSQALHADVPGVPANIDDRLYSSNAGLQDTTAATAWINAVGVIQRRLDWGTIPDRLLPGTNTTDSRPLTEQLRSVNLRNALQPTNAGFSEEDLPEYRTAARALRQIDAWNSATPNFTAVGFYLPHLPLYVPQRWIDVANSVPLEVTGMNERNLPELTPYKSDLVANENTFFNNTELSESFYRHHLAGIAYVDELVEIIVTEALQKENTIVILWSDHGYEIGSRNAVGKGQLWDESVRIPFIIARSNDLLPASTSGVAGRTSKAIVSSLDIFPTLSDLAGIPMPVDFTRDGRTLLPLMTADPNGLGGGVEAEPLWPFGAITGVYNPNNDALDAAYRWPLSDATSLSNDQAETDYPDSAMVFSIDRLSQAFKPVAAAGDFSPDPLYSPEGNESIAEGINRITRDNPIQLSRIVPGFSGTLAAGRTQHLGEFYRRSDNLRRPESDNLLDDPARDFDAADPDGAASIADRVVALITAQAKRQEPPKVNFALQRRIQSDGPLIQQAIATGMTPEEAEIEVQNTRWELSNVVFEFQIRDVNRDQVVVRLKRQEGIRVEPWLWRRIDDAEQVGPVLKVGDVVPIVQSFDDGYQSARFMVKLTVEPNASGNRDVEFTISDGVHTTAVAIDAQSRMALAVDVLTNDLSSNNGVTGLLSAGAATLPDPGIRVKLFDIDGSYFGEPGVQSYTRRAFYAILGRTNPFQKLIDEATAGSQRLNRQWQARMVDLEPGTYTVRIIAGGFADGVAEEPPVFLELPLTVVPGS